MPDENDNTECLELINKFSEIIKGKIGISIETDTNLVAALCTISARTLASLSGDMEHLQDGIKLFNIELTRVANESLRIVQCTLSPSNQNIH